MGKGFLMGAGGGGNGSDDVTATKDHLVEGYTAILSDSDDEPAEGTLPNNGSVQVAEQLSTDGANTELRARFPYGAYYKENYQGNVLSPYIRMAFDKVRSAIGYTNAAKVLNDTTIAGLKGTLVKRGNYNVGDVANDSGNSRINIYIDQGGYVNGNSSHSNRHGLYILYSTLRNVLGITAEKLWPGNTIAGVTSNKQTMAGGTKTPTTSQQTIACNGKAMTSNIIIPGFSLPAANIIKKGATVTIYGKSVTGTWEGYVADPNYLYKPGVDSGNWAAEPDNPQDLTKESGMMVLDPSGYGANWIYTRNSYNFTGYTKFNIDVMPVGNNLPTMVRLLRYKNDGGIGDDIDEIESPGFSNGVRKTLTFDISNFNATCQPQIWFYRSTSPNYKMNIYNVWFS